ncbi:alpha-ketoglutarate-dependent 2,4-dichlorophenoxyacetate dioxygenase [Constrictibacter sp. MBR-5]|jgi:alpha-ketoglutarate-dependent 2,4-dichlorophenoxyacetate dioxygenase|uniref:TauD/TfdA dioxygenase family protein n=1 Tax=Constrictibacter sp. MBR-5 TaxID=3156467 RepID=UPI00339541D9
MLAVKPLHPEFVAEIEGVDLRRPVDADTLSQIVAALDRYGVVVFHDQPIDDEQQLAFSRLFGELEISRATLRPGAKLRINQHMSDVSNLDENNKVMEGSDYRRMSGLANRLWHTDSSFKRVPAKYSMLSGRVVPSAGGDTEFSDMRAVYDSLPEKTKAQIEDMIAVHSIFHSRATIGFTDFTAEERAGLPPVQQRLVRTHPGSGRKSLYIASHASEIVGMPVPEGRMMLLDLMDIATRPEFVHAHKWRKDDLVVWDNRCTLHRARPFDPAEPRDMRRTTVAGDGPTVEQALVA